MKHHQTPSSGPGIPDAFLDKFGQPITGILCGFDRRRFRGPLRLLFQPSIRETSLQRCDGLIKHFKTFAQGITQRIETAAYQAAEAAPRPVHDLPGPEVSKEDLARRIAVFSAGEPGLTYAGRGDRQTRQIHLVLAPGKGTHLYHYFLHPDFGLLQVRGQTGFPFTVAVGLTGRECGWPGRGTALDSPTTSATTVSGT